MVGYLVSISLTLIYVYVSVGLHYSRCIAWIGFSVFHLPLVWCFVILVNVDLSSLGI
ncbi:hypothetical protein BJX61DRAFT_497084 [Aspergillus egyptiacus]|nr:hypothetical protein BJX61DRAFT_497084 [Aspergillus egyptiacus]